MIEVVIEKTGEVTTVTASTWDNAAQALWPEFTPPNAPLTRETFYAFMRERLRNVECTSTIYGDAEVPVRRDEDPADSGEQSDSDVPSLRPEVPEDVVPQVPTSNEGGEVNVEDPAQSESDDGGRTDNAATEDAEVPSSGVQHPSDAEPELGIEQGTTPVEGSETGL